MRLHGTLLCFGAVIAGAAGSRSCLIAHTRNGTVQGRHLREYDQDLFLGIPYAKAPRLANPEPFDSKYNGTLDASEYGPTCYGFGSNQLLNLTQSEDCLNLNIIKPSMAAKNEKLPVLVWIYGGGNSQGSSADPMWNLTYVVDTAVRNGQPVIAVSLNYRLSFFGFPGGEAALKAGVTNLGLKDQRLALQWVQENIGSFGGDPSKVTIWGESAGGSSVAFQLISYGGKGGEGLFRSGILVSGFTTGQNPKVSASQLEDGYQSVVEHANCAAADDTLACLRGAPLENIYPGVLGGSPATFGTVIDGDFIQQEPARELASGHVTRVPIILGGDSDEGLFVANTLGVFPNTTAELQSILHASLPGLTNDTVEELLDLYPLGAPGPPYSLPPGYAWCQAMVAAGLGCGTQYRRMASILGDYLNDAPRRYMAQGWASLGLETFSFRFDTDPTSLPIVYWNSLGPGFALHGAELAYQFGLPPGFTTSIDFYPPVKPVQPHIDVSHAIVSKWVSFAHSLDPNAIHVPGVPYWPSYSQSASNMVWNATDTVLNIHVEKDDYREEQIQLWIDNVDAANYFET